MVWWPRSQLRNARPPQSTGAPPQGPPRRWITSWILTPHCSCSNGPGNQDQLPQAAHCVSTEAAMACRGPGWPPGHSGWALCVVAAGGGSLGIRPVQSPGDALSVPGPEDQQAASLVNLPALLSGTDKTQILLSGRQRQQPREPWTATPARLWGQLSPPPPRGWSGPWKEARGSSGPWP